MQETICPIPLEIKQKNEVKLVYIDSHDYCEEPRLDTQRLISLFKASSQQNGFVYTKDLRQADFLIYYACGHLQDKEDESIRDIKELLKLKKSSAKLIVWGCLPKINPAALREVYDGPLVGPEDCWDFFGRYFNLVEKREINVHANVFNTSYMPKHKMNVKLTQKEKLTSIYGIFESQRARIIHFGERRARKNTWYIKIVHGCLNSCTYCSDRLAYKSVKSQPVESIIRQFELGLNRGYRDFFFVGRDLGSYGYDLGITLPDLLDAIISKHGNANFKIWLTGISPNQLINIYPKLEKLLATKKIVYLGSHIQSGSSRILKLMAKNFPLGKWVETIRHIENNYPWVSLETSIMVGFPSETEKDFEKSVRLLSYLHFGRVVMYKYNERPNLPSLKIKNRVSEEIKEARYFRMLDHVTTLEVRERMKPAKIFSFTTLNLFFDIALVNLRGLLRNHFGW